MKRIEDSVERLQGVTTQIDNNVDEVKDTAQRIEQKVDDFTVKHNSHDVSLNLNLHLAGTSEPETKVSRSHKSSEAPLQQPKASSPCNETVGILVSQFGQQTIFSDNGTFVARKQERARLRRLLLPRCSAETPGASHNKSTKVVVLTGPAGAGKTRLIEKFVVEDWRPKFPKATAVRLILSELRPNGADDIASDSERFQRLLQLLAAGLHLNGLADVVEDIEQRLGQWLNEPGALLVIENVDSQSWGRAVSRLVKSLTAKAPQLRVILTSWIQHLGDSQRWAEIPVGLLKVEACLRLLKEELGSRRFADFNPTDLYELVELRLDRLPLALHLAAGHLARGDSPAEYWERLCQQGLDLPPADAADLSRTLHAQFELACIVLEQDLKADRYCPLSSEVLMEGLRCLGSAPLAGFGPSLGAAIAGIPDDGYISLIRAATRLHLIERIPDEYPSSETAGRKNHVRLRSLFAGWLRRRVKSAVASARMTNWFLQRFKEARNCEEQTESEWHTLQTDQGQRWGEIQGEWPALLNWLDSVDPNILADHVEEWTMFAALNGPFERWVSATERAIIATQNQSAHLKLLFIQSHVCLLGGQIDRAFVIANRLLTLAARCEVDRDAGEALSLIATTLAVRGETSEALHIRQTQQLPLYERLGDVRERAVTLGQIADLLTDRGDLDEALRIRQEEELPVYDRIRDVRSRAITLGKIANVLVARGKLDEALRIRREEQLPVYERLGDVRSTAVTLGQIADVLTIRGKFDEALRIRNEKELIVYERLGDIRARTVTLGQIADLLAASGDEKEAFRIRREEQLPAYERLADMRGWAICLSKIADTFADQGNRDEAIRLYETDILPTILQLDDVRVSVWMRRDLARHLIHRSQSDDSQKAEKLLLLALDDAKRLDIPEVTQVRELLDNL